MTPAMDSLLLLLLGSGWSEKKARDLVAELRTTDIDEVLKRYRAMKRALARTKAAKPTNEPVADMNVDRSLRLLQSMGPYSEAEIISLLRDRT